MTRSLLIYVGYPSDLMQQPSAWANRLFHAVSQGDPFDLYLSGGRFTDATTENLAKRDSRRLSRLARTLQGSYMDRMIPSLVSETVENIAQIAQGPASSELRVLADLWVLCRSDVYLVDCDAVGRGRCGMEALYASILKLDTIGVTDSPVQDPWYQYHLGRVVRPHDVLSHLWQIRDSLEAIDAQMAEANRESTEERVENLSGDSEDEVDGD